MKLRTIVKIVATSSVVLLCAGFAVYSFLELSGAKEKKDFNLYELIPSSAAAVFVTDDVMEFVAEIEGLTCSENNQYLHVSKIFSNLKQSLYTLLDDAPHGLSHQMNQMLISFHKPDNVRNQVLYCRLADGDKELIDRFEQKYISSLYPPKTSGYRGEEIKIYPMSDGDFLACYLTPEFMALSYQKKLIEDVIDARKDGKSLADDPSFAETRVPKKSAVTASIYARMDGMIGWTEFDMKLKDDFIYFSGVSHAADSCFTFINLLQRQESVKGFPGETLPSTAFYFSKQGITDWPSMFSYGDMQEYATSDRTREVMERDQVLSRYLMENTGPDLVACLFHREDTLQGAAAVLSLSVADVTEAERMLRSLVKTAPEEEGMRRIPRITFCYTANKVYPVYRLPQTTLFTQLTSFAQPTLRVYATFYGSRLLLAPDEDSLSRYIHQLDKGEVLTGAVAYRAGMDSLSDSCQLMLMADFDQVLGESESQVRFVPDFFLHNADFFRNFILFAQFTCADGVVYPNIVLKYKTE